MMRIGILSDTHDNIPKIEKAVKFFIVADLVIFGHTHKPEVLRQNALLVVNPRECGGWLSGKSTVALVGLDSFSAAIRKI